MSCCNNAHRTLRLIWLVLLIFSTRSQCAEHVTPNILFIMTDQQFADAMSCRMGDDFMHTPSMDSLAASGTIFTRAYVANPLCMPSRNSIFTGRYPHQTGVTNNSKGKQDPNQFLSMGRIFRDAGYETAYFGKWHLFFRETDRAQHGFTNTANLKRETYWDTKISTSAIEFLSQPQAKPFLAVVSFHNPHDACELARGQELPGGPIGNPPAPDKCPPAPINLAPPENETDSMSVLRRGYHASAMFPVGEFAIDDWRQQRWGYYRLIEKVDREIGMVLSALRNGGHDQNTIVVLTSDHGECSGAHRFNQKTVFYDESARVPFIVSWPQKTQVTECDYLVNTGIDIIPTLCDFAGIDCPPGLPGQSVRKLTNASLVSDAPPAGDRHVIIQNHMSQAGQLASFQPEMHGRMVRSHRFKYCVYEFGKRRESLIDMINDPHETKNLAGETAYREVLLEHRRLLAQYAQQQDDRLAADLLADDVAGRPFPNQAE